MSPDDVDMPSDFSPGSRAAANAARRTEGGAAVAVRPPSDPRPSPAPAGDAKPPRGLTPGSRAAANAERRAGGGSAVAVRPPSDPPSDLGPSPATPGDAKPPRGLSPGSRATANAARRAGGETAVAVRPPSDPPSGLRPPPAQPGDADPPRDFASGSRAAANAARRAGGGTAVAVRPPPDPPSGLRPSPPQPGDAKPRRHVPPGSRAAANAALRAAAGTAVAVRPPSDPRPIAVPSGRGEVAPGALATATSAAKDAAMAAAAAAAAFQPATLMVVEEPLSPFRRRVVGTLAAALLAALGWSTFGRIASYAIAAGKVQAVGRTKVVEAQQSGQVVEIVARDGDRVAAGGVVLRLDRSDAAAALQQLVDGRADLTAQDDRRRAELAAARVDPVPSDPAVAWSDGVPERLRERERGVMRADLGQLAATLATLAASRSQAEATVARYSGVLEAQKALVATTTENSAMSDKLQGSGWNSRATALGYIETLRSQQITQASVAGQLADARASLATIDSQALKARETFASKTTDALVAAERQIADLGQQIVKADLTLSRTAVRAPVSGIVHASAVTTLGQVVAPSQQLMQIVPENAPLEVIAYLDNADIGLVRRGQSVLIKVDSFDFAVYGGVDGTVSEIGGDALRTDGKASVEGATLDGSYGMSTAAQQTGTLKFPVTVRMDRPTIAVDGKPFRLVPGMSVSIEIETELRRLIDYVTSPVLELFSTAAHER